MSGIVLDTNVLVSAIIHDGKPRRLLRTILDNPEHSLILSQPILDEVLDVLRRPKFQMPKNEIFEYGSYLHQISVVVNAGSRFRVVMDDPDDDIVINTAYDGHADYIVTGDHGLLQVGEFQMIRIVTVNKMLALLKEAKS